MSMMIQSEMYAFSSLIGLYLQHSRFKSCLFKLPLILHSLTVDMIDQLKQLFFNFDL